MKIGRLWSPQPMEIGRRDANIFEPTQFALKRIYRVQWKKPSLNLDELAKLYWDEGLTIKEITRRLGASRTQVKKKLKEMLPMARKTKVQNF